MNKYRKITSRKNKRKNKQKKIKSNKKFRNRYQIGCSRKNNMKGGGLSPFQGLSDALNAITSSAENVLSSYAGTPTQDSPNPTVQPHLGK